MDPTASRLATRSSEALQLVLACDTIVDPRDLAEVIHLAAAFGLEVHLLGKSISPRHWKVLRKLESWRPELARNPDRIPAKVFPDTMAWACEMRASGFALVGMVVVAGSRPAPEAARGKAAILFGEETHGLSEDLLALCDHRWTLPLGPGGRFFTVGQATALILGSILL